MRKRTKEEGPKRRNRKERGKEEEEIGRETRSRSKRERASEQEREGHNGRREERRDEARSGEEELGGAVWYTTWYAVALRRGHAAVPSACGPRRGLEAARRGSARCATPWCCRLTYLSAVVPPATGSAASVQSGVLPICIPDSPAGRSSDSPVYSFSLYRGVSPRPLVLSLSFIAFVRLLSFAHLSSSRLSLSLLFLLLVLFVRPPAITVRGT